MREQDDAAGYPSIALPYGLEAPSGKRPARRRGERRSRPKRARAIRRTVAARGAAAAAEVLRRLGVSPDEAAEAREAAHRNGSDLAAELIASGRIAPAALAEAIAATLGLEAAEIPTGRPVLEVGSRRLLRVGGPGETVFIAPRLEDFGAIRRLLRRFPQAPGAVAVATESELHRARAEASRAARVRNARLSLAADRPEFSARHTFSGAQGFVAGGAMAIAAVAALVVPFFFTALHLLLIPLYAACIALRLGALAALLRRRLRGRPAALAPAVPDGPRPLYSVLVALRGESEETVAALVAALKRLRWPRSRLDVLLICEADDPETVSVVAQAIANEPNFRLVEVPPGGPRTKPKALRFALPLARGEFVALFDAEDEPAPEQLEAAFAAFAAGDERLACVQAPLVVSNGEKSWLAAHFAIEYAVLFLGLLPWLAAKGMPLPLGGTSNHFRRSALETAGGWDSHNVTEDADLGMRLARHGFRTGTIAPPTREEAPEQFCHWRNQRTRWMKGWLQTYAVHMRSPKRTRRELGWRDFAVFQLLFGGMLLSSLANSLLLAILAHTAWTVLRGGWPEGLAGAILAAEGVVLVLGHAAYGGLALLCTPRSRHRWLLRHLPGLPLYWLLVSLATLRALLQLFRAPHLWEKTPHGRAARKAPKPRRRPRWLPRFFA